jgi:hypothetical protein
MLMCQSLVDSKYDQASHMRDQLELDLRAALTGALPSPASKKNSHGPSVHRQLSSAVSPAGNGGGSSEAVLQLKVFIHLGFK